MLMEEKQNIEEICSSTWETIYRFVYYKVQNREEAEDITQETYVKALSYIQNGHGKVDKTIGFLKTVSLNVLRDQWRKRKRSGIAVNIDAVNTGETAVDDSTKESAQRDWIVHALDCLTKEKRTVIELRIIKGYSVAETARIMEKNQSTIRVMQYRALQELVKILEDDH